jgi:hypothetical protein
VWVVIANDIMDVVGKQGKADAMPMAKPAKILAHRPKRANDDLLAKGKLFPYLIRLPAL